MEGVNFPDLLDILIRVGQLGPFLISLLQSICLMCSVWFGLMGLLHMYGTASVGTSRFLSGRAQSTYGLATSYLIVSAILSLFVQLEFIGVLNSTLTGGDVAQPINSNQLQYNGGGNTQQRLQLATYAVLSLLQFIGFVAMVRGVILIKDINEGRVDASISRSVIYITAGVLAWDFEFFINALNNQLGYDFIGLFSPFR